jgi:uncharacterized integral membrane protein
MNDGEEGIGHVHSIERPRRRWIPSTTRLVALWAIALGLLLLVIFIADNFVLVEVRVMHMQIQARLGWVVFIASVIGGLVGLVVGRISARVGRFRLHRETPE